MILSWSISSDSIELTVYCKISQGYCAIGLSKSLDDGDMMGVVSDGTSVALLDYFSYPGAPPSLDTDLGGTNDLEYLSGGLDLDGYINVTFKRKLYTDDKFDQTIEPDTRSQICWVHTEQVQGWDKHDRKGKNHLDAATFSFATSASSLYFTVIGNEEYSHGVELSIAWGILAPIGVIGPRYFKHTSWWIYLHVLALLSTSIITVLSVTNIYKVELLSLEELKKKFLIHSRLGMIMTSLLAFQVFCGIATYYFKANTTNRLGIGLVRKMHQIVGICMLLVGMFVCTKGWILYGDPVGLEVFGKNLVVVCVVFAGLEIRQVRRRRRNEKKIENLQEITHSEASWRISNGEELMFVDDLVVDVKQFKFSHPGGLTVMQTSVGEDVGKYMVGCSSFDDSLDPHMHSAKALSYLNSLAIARIPYPVGYIVVQDSLCNNEHMEFSLSTKEQLGLDTFLVCLKSDFFKMSGACMDAAWLGKHFKITIERRYSLVKRYYSSVFVDLNEWRRELGISKEEINQQEQGVVRLIFKVYPGGVMTSFLDSLEVGENLVLQGPLGPGLMINEIEGNCIAIAGGTGLVPFLDLVYYAWKEMATNARKFHLTLLIRFKTLQHGFAIDILEKMKEISEGNWFNVIILTDDNEEKGNISKILRKVTGNGVSKAWVCGPSGFNRHFYNLLIKLGLTKSNIVLM